MAKRCSRRRSLRNNRRTRRGGGLGFVARGSGLGIQGMQEGGGRKKMMRTHRRTKRGGVTLALGDLRAIEGGGVVHVEVIR